MHLTAILESERLRLVASTEAHLLTELNAPEQLAAMLGAVVSNAWPSGEYDRDAMEFFLARLQEGGPTAVGWYGWYALGKEGGGLALLGAGGYFGPPGVDGDVEIGYSVLPEWQGRGYASETVRLLVDHAFSFDTVKRVVAHTAEDNAASIKVLARCGFIPAGAGAEPGTLRFVRHRGTGQ